MKEIRENQNCLNLLNQLSGSTNANTTFMNEVFSDLDKDNDGFVSKIEAYAAKTGDAEDRDNPYDWECPEFGKTKINCSQCLEYRVCAQWANMGGGRRVLCNCKSKKCEGQKPLINGCGKLLGYKTHNVCERTP